MFSEVSTVLDRIDRTHKFHLSTIVYDVTPVLPTTDGVDLYSYVLWRRVCDKLFRLHDYSSRKTLNTVCYETLSGRARDVLVHSQIPEQRNVRLDWLELRDHLDSHFLRGAEQRTLRRKLGEITRDPTERLVHFYDRFTTLSNAAFAHRDQCYTKYEEVLCFLDALNDHPIQKRLFRSLPANPSLIEVMREASSLLDTTRPPVPVAVACSRDPIVRHNHNASDKGTRPLDHTDRARSPPRKRHRPHDQTTRSFVPQSRTVATVVAASGESTAPLNHQSTQTDVMFEFTRRRRRTQKHKRRRRQTKLSPACAPKPSHPPDNPPGPPTTTRLLPMNEPAPSPSHRSCYEADHAPNHGAQPRPPEPAVTPSADVKLGRDNRMTPEKRYFA